VEAGGSVGWVLVALLAVLLAVLVLPADAVVVTVVERVRISCIAGTMCGAVW
jgi:hypothetical protein